MASSARPCAMDACKNPSRTICICCDSCFCLDHLAQHFSKISNQLPPLIDKVDGFTSRLNRVSPIESPYLLALEKWREEAHRTVDRYYEVKRRDFIDDRRHKLKKELVRLRNLLDKLIRKHDATREQVDLLTQDVRAIEKKFNEFQHLRFTIHPLVIENNLILLDLLPPPAPCRTIKIQFDEWSSLANNEKSLLVQNESNLCLLDRHLAVVKEIPWTNGEIWDMCWSSTLARFILVTDKNIYTLDETAMTVARCQITSNTEWSRATCSDTGLFLLTQGLSPSIFEYKLRPAIKPVKEWQPPKTCEADEYIFDLKSMHNSLAAIIYNTQNDKTRLELRSSTTFDPLWSILVDRGFRCCLLHGDQWMVVDPLHRRLFHISNDGKLLKMDGYPQQPWNIIQWGKYMIGVRTKEGINLH